MEIQQEIEQAILATGELESMVPSAYLIADALMPLVKRAQAEAWDEGYKHYGENRDDSRAIEDNPYREQGETA